MHSGKGDTLLDLDGLSFGLGLLDNNTDKPNGSVKGVAITRRILMILIVETRLRQ